MEIDAPGLSGGDHRPQGGCEQPLSDGTADESAHQQRAIRSSGGVIRRALPQGRTQPTGEGAQRNHHAREQGKQEKGRRETDQIVTHGAQQVS